MLKANKLVNTILIFLIPFFLCSQSIKKIFEVNYKGRNVNIDSIILYMNEKRVGNYEQSYFKINLDSSYVYVFCFKKKKICLELENNFLMCDTTKIFINNWYKCSRNSSTVGYFQTCLGSSHCFSFFSNYYPCCNKRWRIYR
jgi:hypothetical protein